MDMLKASSRRSRRWFACSAGAISAIALAAPGVATAADITGSGAVVTNRICETSNDSCVVMGPNGPGFAGGDRRINAHQYFGGYGQGLTASPTLGGGSTAAAEVSFGDDYLPVLRLGSNAGIETRTGASATTFRSFTYNGDVAIDLAIAGQLHFLTSGDVLGTPGLDEFTGDGTLNVALALVWVSNILDAFGPGSTGRDIISNVTTSFSDCGQAGVIAASGFNSGGFGGGEYHQTVGLSQACGGGAIRINPGDSFAIIATMQAISNRGGFIDAMNTFRVQYDEENTFVAGTQQAVETGFLRGAVVADAAIPEPTTWALMIGGFGLSGAALRRRRNALA